MPQVKTYPRLISFPGADTETSEAQGSEFIRLLRWNNLVEIQGPPASGKTHIIYLAIMTCVLQPQYNGVQLNGWGQAAIVLDTDVAFDIRRLQDLLRVHVERRLLLADYASPTQTSRRIVNQAFSRLHIFQPHSSTQLAATILRVPRYHAETASLADCELGLLAVDSLSAFYWEDRFTTEQLRGGQSHEARTPFRHVLSAIDTFRTQYPCPVLVTNWGLNPLNASTGSSPFFKQHLYPSHSDFVTPSIGGFTAGKPASSAILLTAVAPPEPTFSTAHSSYTLSLTHHITLLPIHLPPFPTGVSLEDAAREDEQHRYTTVQRGEAHGLVRVPSNPEVGRFGCVISADSVSVEPEKTFVQ